MPVAVVDPVAADQQASSAAAAVPPWTARSVRPAPAAGLDHVDGYGPVRGFGEPPGLGRHPFVQPDLDVCAQVPYALETFAACVEVAAVLSVVQVETAGEEPGLDGLEHPAVGIAEPLGEDPGVDGFEHGLAGGLGRVVLAGEPGGVEAEPAVVDEGGHAGGELGGHFGEMDVEPGSGEVFGEAGHTGRVDASGRAVEVPPQSERVTFDDLQQSALDRVVQALSGGDPRVVEVMGAGQRTQLSLTPVQVGERDGRPDFGPLPAGQPFLAARPQGRGVGCQGAIRELLAGVLPVGVRRQLVGAVQPQALAGQLCGRGAQRGVGVAGGRHAVAAVPLDSFRYGGDPGALGVAEGGAERHPVGGPQAELAGVGHLGGERGVAGWRARGVLDGLHPADDAADRVDQGFQRQRRHRRISCTGSVGAGRVRSAGRRSTTVPGSTSRREASSRVAETGSSPV